MVAGKADDGARWWVELGAAAGLSLHGGPSTSDAASSTATLAAAAPLVHMREVVVFWSPTRCLDLLCRVSRPLLDRLVCGCA